MRKTKRREQPQFLSTADVVRRLNCSYPLALAWANLNRLCKVAAAYVWTENDINAFHEELEK